MLAAVAACAARCLEALADHFGARVASTSSIGLSERIQQSFVIADPSLPDSPIVFASDGFLDFTGYTREEILGRNCRFLQGPRTDARAVREIREAVDQGDECTVRLLNYTKQGKPFWNMFTLAPVRDETGRIRFFAGIQVDVTVYKKRDASDAATSGAPRASSPGPSPSSSSPRARTRSSRATRSRPTGGRARTSA